MFAERIAGFYQTGFAADKNPDFFDLLSSKFEGEQLDPRFVAICRFTYDANEFVEISESNEIAFEGLGPFLGRAQLKAGPAQDDFAAMLDVGSVGILQRKEFWPAVIDRQHDNGKRAFQCGVLVKIVDNNLWVSVAFQFDHDARVFVGFIPDGSDVRDRLLVYELGDALDQSGAIHVIRNFRDHDLFLAAFDFLDASFPAHFHAAPAGLEILFDPCLAVDRATGGEIRPLHMLHQLFQSDVGVVDLCANAFDNFAKVVGRYISRHSNRDASAAINEQIWKRGRENRRFGARLVVISDKVDRVLLHVGHERGAEMGHARFGVTHGGRRISLDRAEVALTIDEPFPHRPWLRHVDQRGVDHRFAVRMIITAGVAADFRAFAMLSIWKQRQIMHRVEDSSLRWFEPVTRIRDRTRDNDRHRVIEERPR